MSDVRRDPREAYPVESGPEMVPLDFRLEMIEMGIVWDCEPEQAENAARLDNEDELPF